MRIALLSDIHGNLMALEAVLADMRQQGAVRSGCRRGRSGLVGAMAGGGRGSGAEVATAVIQGNTDAFFRARPGETPPARMKIGSSRTSSG